MKNTINFLQIFLLICGVFGADADEVKTVMEGESVTLNTDLTETQGFNQILWRFGDKGPVIAQIDGIDISYPHLTEIFGGRLQLDHQTGSLTIKNMRIKHSGLYKLKISQNTGSSPMTFRVTVYESPAVIDAYKAEMKTVPGTEGNPVTLQTDVTEPHGDELIVWRFGDEGKLIAKHDIEAKSSPLYDTDVRFRERLKLDEKTGSLNITNTKNIKDSGLYTVKISSSKQTLYKKFNVIISAPGLSSGAVAGIVIGVLLVFAVVAAAAGGVIYYRRKISELKGQMFTNEERIISVTKGKNVILNPETEIQKDDEIKWMFGGQDILKTEIRGGTVKTNYSADERFRNKLTLDEKTGSLIITNITTEHTGDYKLQISSRGTINKRFAVTVCESLKSVKEGKSVTLNPETEIQKEDQIQWMFGDQDIIIADIKGGTGETHDDNVRFRGRLKLDEKTGSLIITNMRLEHIGVYKLQIISSRGTTNKRFKVIVVCNSYTPKKVLEGNELTLSSDTSIIKDEKVNWFFNDEILAIGKSGDINNISYCDDERFKGRLELDHKTGSLTIKNTEISDTGVYHLKFPSLGIGRKFRVTVNEDVPLPRPPLKQPESEYENDAPIIRNQTDSSGNRENDVTVVMPLLDEENEHEGTSSL